MIIKVDSFPGFPRVNAVQPETEACLTAGYPVKFLSLLSE